MNPPLPPGKDSNLSFGHHGYRDYEEQDKRIPPSKQQVEAIRAGLDRMTAEIKAKQDAETKARLERAIETSLRDLYISNGMIVDERGYPRTDVAACVRERLIPALRAEGFPI